MADEQPSFFSIFDLFWELVQFLLVVLGCYVGWKLGGHFLALLAGGIIGRAVGYSAAYGVASWAGSRG